jgi:hypothetical protein
LHSFGSVLYSVGMEYRADKFVLLFLVSTPSFFVAGVPLLPFFSLIYFALIFFLLSGELTEFMMSRKNVVNAVISIVTTETHQHILNSAITTRHSILQQLCNPQPWRAAVSCQSAILYNVRQVRRPTQNLQIFHRRQCSPDFNSCHYGQNFDSKNVCTSRIRDQCVR